MLMVHMTGETKNPARDESGHVGNIAVMHIGYGKQPTYAQDLEGDQQQCNRNIDNLRGEGGCQGTSKRYGNEEAHARNNQLRKHL